MGEYTNFFETLSYDIFEAEDYVEELKNFCKIKGIRCHVI